MVEKEPIIYTIHESKEALFGVIPVMETKSSPPLVESLDSILESFFNYFQPQEEQLLYYFVMGLFILLHYYFSPLYGGVSLYLLIVFTITYGIFLLVKVILKLFYRFIIMLLKYLKKIIFKIRLKFF